MNQTALVLRMLHLGTLAVWGRLMQGRLNLEDLPINKRRDFKMTINDPIFGELEYKYSWSKDTTIHFFLKRN